MKNLFSSPYKLVALVIVVPLLAFATVHWLESSHRSLPVLNKSNNLEDLDYHFKNQHNKTKSFSDWKNKLLVVDFFFTRCSGICPKMTNNLVTVSKQYDNDPEVQFLSFTVDPSSDSSNSLLAYSKNMEATNSNWDFLTGDKITIYRLARKQFFVTATDGDGGPEDFIHSDKVILIDKQRGIRGYYNGTNESETKQLIKDIKILKYEK